MAPPDRGLATTVMPLLFLCMSECPAAFGSGPPKLGRVTVFVPPETETPGTRPLYLSPAPPGPAKVELPVCGEASAPLPGPEKLAPEFDPAEELPEPLPCVMPEPPPEFPAPAAFPAGDIASIVRSGFAG